MARPSQPDASIGQFSAPNALVLCGVPRRLATDPEACVFALWFGCGLPGIPPLSVGSPPADPLPDPIPKTRREGTLNRLPHCKRWLEHWRHGRGDRRPGGGPERPARQRGLVRESGLVCRNSVRPDPDVRRRVGCTDRAARRRRSGRSPPASPDDPVGGLAPVVLELGRRARGGAHQRASSSHDPDGHGRGLTRAPDATAGTGASDPCPHRALRRFPSRQRCTVAHRRTFAGRWALASPTRPLVPIRWRSPPLRAASSSARRGQCRRPRRRCRARPARTRPGARGEAGRS